MEAAMKSSSSTSRSLRSSIVNSNILQTSLDAEKVDEDNVSTSSVNDEENDDIPLQKVIGDNDNVVDQDNIEVDTNESNKSEEAQETTINTAKQVRREKALKSKISDTATVDKILYARKKGKEHNQSKENDNEL